LERESNRDGVCTSVYSPKASKSLVISKLRILSSAVIVLVLSTALCVSADPQSSAAASARSQHAIAVRRKGTGIPNFAEVTPHLYRGGQPGIKGIAALKKMNVDIVVDMRGGRNKKEEAAARKLGMSYVPISWHCPFPTDKPFARFLKLVEQNSGKKIFVHCRLGDDRTGMAVAAYRMAEEGWSADEAMNEMRLLGFTRAHHAICPTLAHYEKDFPHRLRTSSAFKDLHLNSSSPK